MKYFIRDSDPMDCSPVILEIKDLQVVRVVRIGDPDFGKIMDGTRLADMHNSRYVGDNS